MKFFIAFNSETNTPFASANSMKGLAEIIGVSMSTLKYLSATGNVSKKYKLYIRTVEHKE